MATANVPAKAIFDAVRGEHKGGALWNTLTSIFRLAVESRIPFHINDLKKLECHKKFRLDKLVAIDGETVRVTEKRGEYPDGAFSESAQPDWSVS